MDSTGQLLYHLAFYSSEMRWTGYMPILSHRRMSDHFNDKNVENLNLTRVVPATWHNGALVERPQVDSVLVFKNQMLLIAPLPDSPSKTPDPTSIVPKKPFRVLIHIPTLTLEGDLHIGRVAEWPDAWTTLRSDFLPVTNVLIAHTLLSKLVDRVPFLLLNRSAVIALEPRK